MPVRRADAETPTLEYGVHSRRLYPWEDIARTPFGSMWSRIEPGGSTVGHQHHEAETFLVARGHGRIRVGSEEHRVKAGDVVYAPPFSEHRITNASGTEVMEVIAIWWEAAGALALGREPARPKTARTLVTATPPTVNGGLHLGHLAGPYLAADVLVRHRRLRGQSAYYVTGVDDHQSYVATRARAEGSTPRAIADRYADEVERSLASCDIAVDVCARPARSAHHVRWVRRFFRKLYETGALEARTTPSPYCDRCEIDLFEAHLGGGCPHCGVASDGCACEACGRPNDCADLIAPRCHRCGSAPRLRPSERLYFPLARHAERLRRFHREVAMPPHLRALCERMLAEGLPDIAVTHRTDWGIPVPVDGFDGQSIYVWFEMAPGYLAATDELADAHPELESWETLWKSDDAEVLQCFGFDNGYFHALLFPALWLAFDPDIRLPRSFVTNEFYLLDGEKFSTSRRHAIWATEFADEQPVDAIRYHLAIDRPESHSTSFTRGAFDRTRSRVLEERWLDWLGAVGERVQTEFAGRAPTTGGYTDLQRRFLARIERTVADIDESLDVREPSLVRLARALDGLVDTADRFGRSESHRSRGLGADDERATAVALELLAVRTLAVTAAPLLPRLSERLWRALGYDGAVERWLDRPHFVPADQDVTGLVALAAEGLDGGPER